MRDRIGPDERPQIEKAGPESIQEAFSLLRQFFAEEGFNTPAESMYNSLQTMLEEERSAVFLARLGGQAVGVATATCSVGVEYGRSSEMEDLYVQPQVRGAGVAGALIEAVRGWCRRQGCKCLLVTVTPEGQDRHNLIGFYRRRGFVHTGRVIMEQELL